jgi:hypothetical protein
MDSFGTPGKSFMYIYLIASVVIDVQSSSSSPGKRPLLFSPSKPYRGKDPTKDFRTVAWKSTLPDRHPIELMSI